MSTKREGKRKAVEIEGEGSTVSTSSKRRSVRISSQTSDTSELVSATSELRISSVNYGLEDLPSSASQFTKRAVKAFKVNFRAARTEKNVIPNVNSTYCIRALFIFLISKPILIIFKYYQVTEVAFPMEYVLPDINRDELSKKIFSVKQLRNRSDNPITDGRVLSFIKKLRGIVYAPDVNPDSKIGTSEADTDSLVDDLIRIVDFNNWPLTIKNHPVFHIYIRGAPYVSSIPEFAIIKEPQEEGLNDFALIAIGGKHIKNVVMGTEFGEVQIAAEIIACGSQNMYLLNEFVGGEGGERVEKVEEAEAVEEIEEVEEVVEENYTNQTIYAIRVIATYVTFYKVEIPATYWEELDEGLPDKENITIRRWPKKMV
ncbi:hypothetical protein RclHR1_00740026 [Rhizophagus clarus]|uniref:Uncharacterized protein n=1 Tax=Rhizophagus clarus TaxID=94130 RepID=A0A2Z6S334_9GLOM|nr:hypothetical protein RclHR1_00740026 [Rhizophagus clarus]